MGFFFIGLSGFLCCKIKESKEKRKTSSGILKWYQSLPTEGLFTIDTAVKIRTLNEEMKKTDEISRSAVEFRQKALYGSNTKRMPSEWFYLSTLLLL